MEKTLKTATFAGGCFWCMEAPFRILSGVVNVTSGYAGGIKENPTYEEVSSGKTGHLESVQVTYDPEKISYDTRKEVKVSSKPGCNNCRMTKEFLRSKNIAFQDINIAKDDKARDWLIEKTGHIGTPVIQVGEEFVIGSDRKKLETPLKNF